MSNNSLSAKPTVGQILAALLASALVPALLVGALSFSIRIVFSAFLVTAAHAVVLGLPLALILNWRNRISQATSLLCGFIVGSIAVGIWAWPLKYSGLKTDSFRGADRVQTMIDGVPTLAGWMDYLLLVGVLGLFGLIGGSIFWAFLSKFIETGAFQKRKPSTEGRVWKHRIIILAPFVIVAAVIAIPSLTKDRSCHNVFRNTSFFDGERSISPKASYKVEVDGRDWLLIQSVFEDFAISNALLFRNSSTNHGPEHKGVYLSLCNELGTSVSVVAYNLFDPADFNMGLSVPVYSVSENENWKTVSAELERRLRAEFPNRVSVNARD